MKNILIIGGSHGISHALADQLRESGHSVIAANRTGSGDMHQRYPRIG